MNTPPQPAQKINCFSWLIQKRISINWQLWCAICMRKIGVHTPVGHDPWDRAIVNTQRSAEGTDPDWSECQQWTAASAAWLTLAFLCLLAELNNPRRHNINTHTHRVPSEYSISPIGTKRSQLGFSKIIQTDNHESSTSTDLFRLGFRHKSLWYLLNCGLHESHTWLRVRNCYQDKSLCSG